MSEQEELLNTWLRQVTALEKTLGQLAKHSAAPIEGNDNLESLQINMEVLSSTFKEASSILLKIEGLSGPNPRRETLVPLYIAAKSHFQKRINKLTECVEASNSNQRPLLDQTMFATTTRQDHLPRIDLPRFNGSPTEWLAFKTRFERRIATLTEDSTKYAFLGKCLEKFEPARNSCEAFENAGVSFDEAWSKLEERFYKKRLAFEGQFYTLLKTKKMSKPDPKGVLHLIDVVDTTISTSSKIANANNEVDMSAVANGLIMCLVKERLDETTRSKLEEKLDLQRIYNWKEYKNELEKVGNQLSSRIVCEHQNTKTSNYKTAAMAAAPKAETSKPKGPNRFSL